MSIQKRLDAAFRDYTHSYDFSEAELTQEMFSEHMLGKNTLVDIQQNPDGSRDIGDQVNLVLWRTTEESRWLIMSATLSSATVVAQGCRFVAPLFSLEHKHNYVELAFVVEGRLKQRISGKDVEFGEGEVCLIDRDSLHGDYLFAENATTIFLSINNSFFNEFLLPGSSNTTTEQFIREIIWKRTEQYSYVRFTPRTTAPASRRATEHIVTELLAHAPGSANLVRGYTERLLGLLPGEYLVNLSRQEKSRYHSLLLEDIQNYMLEHYQSVSLQQLAQRFSYNEEYISRLIRKRTSLTYVQYLQKIRLENALKLLKTTSLTVEEVAARVGYANLGFFYEKFKQAYGKTPRQARK